MRFCHVVYLRLCVGVALAVVCLRAGPSLAQTSFGTLSILPGSYSPDTGNTAYPALVGLGLRAGTGSGWRFNSWSFRPVNFGTYAVGGAVSRDFNTSTDYVGTAYVTALGDGSVSLRVVVPALSRDSTITMAPWSSVDTYWYGGSYAAPMVTIALSFPAGYEGSTTSRPSTSQPTTPTTQPGATDFGPKELISGAKTKMATVLTSHGIDNMNIWAARTSASGELSADQVFTKLDTITGSFGSHSARADDDQATGAHIAGTTYNDVIKAAVAIPYNLKADYPGVVSWVRLAGTLFIAVAMSAEAATAIAWGLGMREPDMFRAWFTWAGSWLPWNNDDDGEASYNETDTADALRAVQNDPAAVQYVWDRAPEEEKDVLRTPDNGVDADDIDFILHRPAPGGATTSAMMDDDDLGEDAEG